MDKGFKKVNDPNKIKEICTQFCLEFIPEHISGKIVEES